MSAIELFLWILVGVVGVLLLTALLLAVAGLFIAAQRSARGLKPGHREFTRNLLRYADTAGPNGCLPTSLIRMEAEQCGVSRG